MSKTLLYIVRHGETDWNVSKRMQGKTDVPLNDTGREQAEKIASHLKTVHIDVIYSSPLSRALETAHIIKKHHPKANFVTKKALMERSFGQLEGLTHEKYDKLHPALNWETTWLYPDFRVPGGESLTDVYSRVMQLINRILKKDEGKSIALVAHGVTIRMIIGAFLTLPISLLGSFDMKNASLTLLEYSSVHGATMHLTNYSV